MLIRYLVADNRTTELGGWDDEKLVQVLSDLAAGPGLDGTGYDGDDLDQKIMDLASPFVDPPEDFPEYGEDINTDHCCPKCGYEWSGSIN